MTSASPIALDVRDVSKTYFLWATPASRLWVPLLHRLAGLVRWLPPLSSRLQRASEARLHRHQALEGITFSLARGEALGIVGLNGSGKSTLLQIIAGVLPATRGTVAVDGRIAALLELGSGFNPELTGRENVRVNAAILGLTPAQIRERMDDILAFADIGAFIDEPVKTYSSGMAVRLAFAVQVHTDPDILIVDEALAVGDAAFQAKAMTRIQEILARGTTLLFVGHDLNMLRAFCQRGILLEAGQAVLQAAPEEVIEEYLFRIHAKALPPSAPKPTRTEQGFESDDGAIHAVRLADGAAHLSFGFGAPLPVSVDLSVAPEVQHAACIVDILDERGVPLTGRRVRLPVRTEGNARLALRMVFTARLARGIYRVRVRLVEAPTALHHARVLCRYDSGLSFEIVDDSVEQFTGLFPMPCEISVSAEPAAVDG
jgi:lipopolysaccharide transport system ATP-binding protein